MLHIIVAYRGIPEAPGWALGACLARAFRRSGHKVTEYGNYYQREERVGADPLPKEADALVYCECNDRDPQYLELRSVAVRWKIYWDFDVAVHPGFTLAFVKKMGFTHVFCANKRYQRLFSAVCKDVYYLPIGVDEELYYPWEGAVKSVPVGLCGTPYPGRVHLIEMLAQAGIDARLETGRYADEYVKAVNRYQIHLNHEVGGGRGLLPGRVWETPACRTLLLTEREDFITLFFQDMQEAVLYSSPADCLEKVRFLLAHPKETERIAAQGYRMVVNAHTYRHRAQSILEAVTAGRRPVWDADVLTSDRKTIQEARRLIFRYQIGSRFPGAGLLIRSVRRPK